MGFSKGKTIEREKLSGHHVAIDVADGTHSVNELLRRNEARQQAINTAHQKDYPKDMTSIVPEGSTPILADAMAKAARPSDYSSKGGERFGVSKGDGAEPGKTANQGKPVPDSNSKVSK